VFLSTQQRQRKTTMWQERWGFRGAPGDRLDTLVAPWLPAHSTPNTVCSPGPTPATEGGAVSAGCSLLLVPTGVADSVMGHLLPPPILLAPCPPHPRPRARWIRDVVGDAKGVARLCDWAELWWCGVWCVRCAVGCGCRKEVLWRGEGEHLGGACRRAR